MHLPRMTPNNCFVFSDKESLAVGSELFVFRKDVFAHVIYQYSLLTNTWSTGMQMNVPRCLSGKESLGEIAIFAGSCDSQVPPLVAVVNNQFTLLTMLKCRLGSMKSITKNGFIEVNLWYLVKDLKNGTCSAKSNQVALCILFCHGMLKRWNMAGCTVDVAGVNQYIIGFWGNRFLDNA
ncbi:F-box/kelch-repeat protein SKIP11 [Capsicum baccatum]|uniref:F-box/kelch-repeat protein SKIP11 n=1 Tax=Capsicum baccatum TaxID=33114 RepID=A0A2G2VLQ7_CAPBA|nr:F-box/kelch-repeat protein SKIP11 [Capsicum baccatum]